MASASSSSSSSVSERKPPPPYTEDTRFLRHNLEAGDINTFKMYSGNIHPESDGLAYNELTVIRAIFLEMFIVIVVYLNVLLAYNNNGPGNKNGWYYFAHTFGAIFNIIRIVISVIILVVECVLWIPLRFLTGAILSPFAFLVSMGWIYALPCSAIHTMLKGAGFTVLRTVKVQPGRDGSKRETATKYNAGGLGSVLAFKTDDYKDAMYIASTYKLKQRCGNGPECIIVRGKYVFVSDWSPLSIQYFFRKQLRYSWKLMDLRTYEWRRVVITFLPGENGEDNSESPTVENNNRRKTSDLSLSMVGHGIETGNKYDHQQTTADTHSNSSVISMDVASTNNGTSTTQDEDGMRRNLVADSQNQNQDRGGANTIEEEIGSWENIVHKADFGTLSTIGEIEELYKSPLGWNKYHLMKAEGNNIQVYRRDRRVVAHIIAFSTSWLFFYLFRTPNSNEGNGMRLISGMDVELYALILANYGFFSAYAAELLVGKVAEIIEAKSDRYGIIVTRAIDRGFVRGFHVPHGDWLCYKNTCLDNATAIHTVNKTDVNFVCNSIVCRVEQNTAENNSNNNDSNNGERNSSRNQLRPESDYKIKMIGYSPHPFNEVEERSILIGEREWQE